MKLSPISLIAAALAATAGCAIAIPRPLHAYALEQVNSFQRDLDVHRRESAVVALERNVAKPVDNLVTRGVSYADAAQIARASTSVFRQAAAMAHEASEKVPGSWTGYTKQQWITKHSQYEKDANDLSAWCRYLEAKRGKPKQRVLEHHLMEVVTRKEKAKLTATDADRDIQGYVRTPPPGGHAGH